MRRGTMRRLIIVVIIEHMASSATTSTGFSVISRSLI